MQNGYVERLNRTVGEDVPDSYEFDTWSSLGFCAMNGSSNTITIIHTNH